MLVLALIAAAAIGQADPQLAPPPEPESAEQQLPLIPPPLPPSADAGSANDPRVQQIPYNPDQVVTLGVGAGYAAVVELGSDERVDNVVVGNSAAWQVTANHRGDRVIVKPLAGATYTNMIVLTDSRRYLFMLDPYGQASYLIRFTYPQPLAQAVDQPAAGTSLGTYKFRGDRALFPAAMHDDGRSTTITWPSRSALPATFAMNGGSRERLVNGRMVGDDFVVEGTASRYKFRLGSAEATATREVPRRRR